MAPNEMPMLEGGASAAALLHVGDYLDAGVLTVDRDLVIRGWNRWLESKTPWQAADAVGRPLLALFPALAGEWAEAAFRRAIEGETVVLAHRFHRYLLPLPPGPAFPSFDHMQQSARIAPLLSAGGTAGAVALIQDVTERVAREAELRDALTAAERASRAKSDFIAVMSHELRTPLTGIIGYCDLLETEITGPLLDQQKDQVRRVKAGAWHLTGIIEEILAFSRVDADREQLHLERIDPSDVAAEAVSMVLPQAEGKGLPVRAHLLETAAELSTDAGKLRQILVNLLGNAVKFTDQGEVVLRVWMESEQVCFEVQDTGPGIPAEFLDRVFEPFTQVESNVHTRVKGGTGLGLAVSRRLAVLLGGDLRVESSLGVGSRFTLAIPCDPGV